MTISREFQLGGGSYPYNPSTQRLGHDNTQAQMGTKLEAPDRRKEEISFLRTFINYKLMPGLNGTLLNPLSDLKINIPNIATTSPNKPTEATLQWNIQKHDSTVTWNEVTCQVVRNHDGSRITGLRFNKDDSKVIGSSFSKKEISEMSIAIAADSIIRERPSK